MVSLLSTSLRQLLNYILYKSFNISVCLVPIKFSFYALLRIHFLTNNKLTKCYQCNSETQKICMKCAQRYCLVHRQDLTSNQLANIVSKTCIKSVGYCTTNVGTVRRLYLSLQLSLIK